MIEFFQHFGLLFHEDVQPAGLDVQDGPFFIRFQICQDSASEKSQSLSATVTFRNAVEQVLLHLVVHFRNHPDLYFIHSA